MSFTKFSIVQSSIRLAILHVPVKPCRTVYQDHLPTVK